MLLYILVGAIDPIQMSQQAPNQEVLYISGWACSSVLTTTNEVSADFGDYPYNTVPNQVQRMFKAQQLHDRKNWDNRRKMSAEERAKTPYLDYMRPIIADGDTGYVTSIAEFWEYADNATATAVFQQSSSWRSCSLKTVPQVSILKTSSTAVRSADILQARSSYLLVTTSTAS
jgi:isocitrate lyase